MLQNQIKRHPSTQDVTWFLDQAENGRLDLKPPYQRRSVWTRKDRIFFLDTIFRGYPCPAIYLHKTLDEKGKAIYHVIDGKQRLETIIMFAENRLTLPSDFPIGDLAGKKWKNIEGEYKKAFWNYVLPVDQFDLVETTLVDEMFDRLNRNSRKLERQELRHAKFDGWFITFVEQLSEDYSLLKELKVVTAGRMKRMKDVQFLSELLAIIIKNQVHGFDQDMLDDMYADYDVPEEETDFNPEEYEKKFYDAIDFISAMNQHNECVNNHATTLGHFYTLFSFVVLTENKPSAIQAADQYDEFMKQYKVFVETNDSDSIDIITYAKNSTGASTELEQRQNRLQALQNVLISSNS